MLIKYKNYDLVIIGSGSAGNTAAIYAARSNLKTLLLTGQQKGGQLTMTDSVENYPGFIDPVNGYELMHQMLEQAKCYGTDVIDEHVTEVDFTHYPFNINTIENKYIAKSAIIATGSNAKWLNMGEEKYAGRGTSTCALCDGFFFKNKSVAVIGGGSSAVEEALYLSDICSQVHLVHRRDCLRAESVLQDRLFAKNNISFHWNSTFQSLITNENDQIIGININNIIENNINIIDCLGVFIAIGHIPNTQIFARQINLDSDNYIITQSNSTKTNIDGVFAAGDVQDKIFKQAVTAAGTGCMAAIEAKQFLQSKQ